MCKTKLDDTTVPSPNVATEMVLKEKNRIKKNKINKNCDNVGVVLSCITHFGGHRFVFYKALLIHHAHSHLSKFSVYLQHRVHKVSAQ